MMDWLRNLVQDRRTERFIMALIVLNAVTLGLETSANRDGEIRARACRHRPHHHRHLRRWKSSRASRCSAAAFFRDGWNIFDVIVVGIALAPATAAFSVLRALRVLRLLRLITAVPALQRVVGGLIGALPGMGSILLLIGLVFYVSAVMAVNLYGKAVSRAVRHARRLALYALHHHDARRLDQRRRQPDHGKAPLCLAVLHSLHRHHHLLGAQSVHRHHRQCHAGGARQGRGRDDARRDGTDRPRASGTEDRDRGAARGGGRPQAPARR